MVIYESKSEDVSPTRLAHEERDGKARAKRAGGRFPAGIFTSGYHN
jgi:hypothetical protein